MPFCNPQIGPYTHLPAPPTAACQHLMQSPIPAAFNMQLPPIQDAFFNYYAQAFAPVPYYFNPSTVAPKPEKDEAPLIDVLEGDYEPLYFPLVSYLFHTSLTDCLANRSIWLPVTFTPTPTQWLSEPRSKMRKCLLGCFLHAISDWRRSIPCSEDTTPTIDVRKENVAPLSKVFVWPEYAKRLGWDDAKSPSSVCKAICDPKNVMWWYDPPRRC